MAALPPIVVNALILPPMWAFAQVGGFGAGFWAACGFNVMTFVLAESVVCYGLGTLLLKALPRIPLFSAHAENSVKMNPAPPCGGAGFLFSFHERRESKRAKHFAPYSPVFAETSARKQVSPAGKFLFARTKSHPSGASAEDAQGSRRTSGEYGETLIHENFINRFQFRKHFPQKSGILYSSGR